MKIVKYKKLSKNKYKLFLDNDETITLYDDVILNNNLLLTKEIDDIDDLLNKNNVYESYNKAIKYIGIKSRCEKELKDYLKRFYSNDIVDDTIKKIKDNNYLNDDIYIKSYIHDKLLLSSDGYYKILRDLKNKNLDEDIIIKYLDEVNHTTWLEKIDKIINKKIKLNNKYSNKYFKEKVLSELSNLGYDREDIIKEVNKIDLSDDLSALEKNYNSILNRLSSKYEGKELESNLITKLMMKGFKYSDIKNMINKKNN